jgi:SAM-dependent methyltransferase
VCDGAELTRYYCCRMDFSEYARQDPELSNYTGEQVWFVRCRDCGFGQPEALPTLNAFFDHAGRFMYLAQQEGWDVEGIELNPRTAAAAAARTGATVHQINAHALALGGHHHYAAVVLTDVLEHIPEPTRLLRTLTSLLEPGGVVAVKVPNGAAQWTKERWLARLTTHRMSLAENLVHVNQFTPRSLVLALERAGFSRPQVVVAAPELPPCVGVVDRVDHAVRRAVFSAASCPGAIHTPLALHLQAFANRDPR